MKDPIRKYKKIVVFGGFSGKNAGDEAQIDATYLYLKKRYPKYFIKIMSHVIRNTYRNHHECLIGESSRAALFNTDCRPCYHHMNEKLRYKLYILATGYLCSLNAYFVKYNMPTFLINARKSAFLYELKTSDLVFFSGGGYLTGATLSRLWDHLFVIKIADILGVPVVCSGQTIGMWNSGFTRRFAKKELKKVKVIMTRDRQDSLDCLKEIGIGGVNVFAACDDAMFCESERDVDQYLQKAGLKGNGFVAVNILKYGSENEGYDLVERNLEKMLHAIVRVKDILFIPFSEDEKAFMEEYVEKIKSEKLHYLPLDCSKFRVIKGLIGRADLCVTMRHHPIIFSASQNIPVITLTYTEYFRHKNNGAMQQFGLDRFCVDMEKNGCTEHFTEVFAEILRDREAIQSEIREKVTELLEKRKRFWEAVDNILKQGM